MDTSDIIQSELIEELDLMQTKFESYYIENLDDSITDEAILYRQKLEKFGFKHNKIIKNHRRITNSKKQLKKINEIALAIKFYKEFYPLYKVIPLQLMIKISEKYNLFFSKSENFIGDIPLKNLDDLENFIKFKRERRYAIPLEKPDILKITSTPYDKIYHTQHTNRSYSSNDDSSRGFYATAPRNQFSFYPKILTIGRLLIKDNGQSSSQFKEIYNELTRPKDPIIWVPVSFPMPGGACMIISKWGEEAKYPEFTNPIEN